MLVQNANKADVVVEADIVLPSTPPKLGVYAGPVTNTNSSNFLEVILSGSQHPSPSNGVIQNEEIVDSAKSWRSISNVLEAQSVLKDMDQQKQHLEHCLADSRKFSKVEPFLLALRKLAEHKKTQLQEELHALVFSGDEVEWFEQARHKAASALLGVSTVPPSYTRAHSELASLSQSVVGH
mmetsp:Transcript_11844/g.24398  ORF Transcript_11844/g.24398 Transcript_11844/m.24398 type:complete len:181 (+) Transcript_11844:56-598(+)